MQPLGASSSATGRRRLAPPQGRVPAQPVGCQIQGVGAGGRALVHDQREGVEGDAGVLEHARDALLGAVQLVAVGGVVGVDVVAQAQAVLAVEGVAEPDRAQVVALVLVAAAPGEAVALAGEALGAEGVEQGGLGLLEFVLAGDAEGGVDVDPAKLSQKAWEEKQEAGKPYRRGRAVRRYQWAAWVLGRCFQRKRTWPP